MLEFLQDPKIVEQLEILRASIGSGIWETLYSIVLSTLFSYVIGLPLGVVLVTGEPGGIHPLPAPLMKVLNFIVNILRSVPFLILMILVIPLSRVLIGTSVGTPALIIPLVIAAFPFVARLVEGSLREMDRGILEAAQAMGCSTLQIICKVLLPECLPSLLTGFTTASITILSYGAMAGIIGGGGVGAIAINYGYYRTKYLVTYVAVIILIIMVQIFQSAGGRLATRLDKRITKAPRKQKDRRKAGPGDSG
jgi:D-methionine transport system permease protein